MDPENKTLDTKKKNDQRLLKILKCQGIRYHIGVTDKGASIDLAVEKGSNAYQFYVDAAPVEKEINDEMLKIYKLI